MKPQKPSFGKSQRRHRRARARRRQFRREKWAQHKQFGPPNRHWNGRSRFIFFRFLLLFGLMALLVAGGMAAMAFVLARLLDASGSTAVLVWISGCSLSVALPLLALRLAIGAFRRIARPLADVMAAADAVADGDLSARVPEQKQGDFRQLARSFNRMATELEIADEQRRNLTADVAHELRTPLHIIQGNLEGVLDGVYEPTHEHIEETLEETQLLGRLVEDLRTLSLAESGHLHMQKEQLDLRHVLADLETSFSGQAESAEIALVFDGVERPLLIHGDADRLTQAFSNIIVNALRHTPSGGNVSVATAVDEAEVQVRITDNGEGIAEDALPFVFDRFWKGDKSRTGSGTGLGLAITRQLVLAHGGAIAVESRLREGTTFVIVLPLDLDNSEFE